MNTGMNAGLHRCRWQERVGGAAGYSTTCLGASNSGRSVPGQFQTFWNCWNNGVNTTGTALYRRCLTYRTMIVPNLPSTDCASAWNGAAFNDFNYMFSGYMGTSGEAVRPLVVGGQHVMVCHSQDKVSYLLPYLVQFATCIVLF